MTRKLEELFDLPPSPPVDPEFRPEPPQISTETLDAIDKVEAALPQVKGLEASDAEMDELANKAIKSYDDLMDLGMNVDSRFAAEILGVASSMLGHAITAKTAKLNKKLKMVDLQMKKLALDQRAATANNGAVPTATGTGHVLDRNELLQRILGAKPKDSEKE
jgi:hypothetical protein